jgi:hypothetical protein
LAETDEDLTRIAAEDEGMKSAVDTILTMSQDPETVRLAEEREESVKLYHGSLHAAELRGKAEGKAEVLEKLLWRRFGPLSDEVIARIGRGTEAELDTWTDRIFDAKSLDEVFAS